MSKNTQKYNIIMAAFAAGITGFVTIVNELTKDIIYEHYMQQQQLLFDQIMSSEFYNNNLKKSCFLVNITEPSIKISRVFIARKDNTPVGVIMEVIASGGYSGSIKLLVATNFNGMVLGTRVTEHHETPGLGDKIELRFSNWILNFAGKFINSDNEAAFAVKKDGGDFDQFTGATITSRAVVNAIKRASLYAKTLPEQIDNLLSCEDVHESN